MGFNKQLNDIFEIDANGVSGWKDMQTFLDWTENQMKYLNNLNTEYGQSQVEALQKVKDAIIDNVGSVQKYKDSYYDLGQEAKKTFELQMQNLSEDYEKSVTSEMQKRIDALEKDKELIEEKYNSTRKGSKGLITLIEEEINALKEKNEEDERAIEKGKTKVSY